MITLRSMWRSSRAGRMSSEDNDEQVSSKGIKPPTRSYEDWVRKGSVLAIVAMVLSICALSGLFLRHSHTLNLHNTLATVAYIPYLDLVHSETLVSDFNPSLVMSNLDTLDKKNVIQQEPQQPGGRSSSPPGCDAQSASLRIFMYDLPADFHYGMITEFKPSKGEIWPRNVSAIPPYPGGLYQQHSPEYWLTSDLLTSTMNDRSAPCTVFRVDRWEDADVMFVPFFASLSYNKYSKAGEQQVKAADRNEVLQLKLVKFLKKQAAWRASGGSDHVIVIHHPNSMHVMREELRKAMFVVADFGRYGKEVANIRKDVVAPYKHVIPTFDQDTNAFQVRTMLLFFQGAIVRKEGGVIRQQLHEMLKNEHGVHFVTGNTGSEGFRSATSGMRFSKFCLNLAGDTPSSNRLFDSIVSHCVPVVISDDIELPYEDFLDYTDFCVFINSSDALKPGFVINLLRSIDSREWTRMWEKLQQVDRHFQYQHPALPDDAVNMVWKAIARKIPAIKFALHKHRRYSRSRSSHKPS